MKTRLSLFASIVAVAVPAMADAQASPKAVRVTTSYSIIGPTPIDTATASARFIAGLQAESLLTVLPLDPLTRSGSRDGGDPTAGLRGARRPGAQFIVLLGVSAVHEKTIIRVRVMNVAASQRAFQDSSRAPTPTDLGEELDRLARTVARRIADMQSGREPHT